MSSIEGHADDHVNDLVQLECMNSNTPDPLVEGSRDGVNAAVFALTGFAVPTHVEMEQHRGKTIAIDLNSGEIIASADSLDGIQDRMLGATEAYVAYAVPTADDLREADTFNVEE
jgi:hypothetical protein